MLPEISAISSGDDAMATEDHPTYLSSTLATKHAPFV